MVDIPIDHMIVIEMLFPVLCYHHKMTFGILFLSSQLCFCCSPNLKIRQFAFLLENIFF